MNDDLKNLHVSQIPHLYKESQGFFSFSYFDIKWFRRSFLAMLGTQTPSTQGEVNDQSTLILQSNNHISVGEHELNCRPSMLK